MELIHSAGTGAVLTILAAPQRDRGLADELFDAVMRHIEVLSIAERQLLTEWLDRISERR